MIWSGLKSFSQTKKDCLLSQMSNSWIRELSEGLLISINVQPRSSKTEIIGIHQNSLKIKLTSPPIEGAANSLLIKFISKELGIAKSNIVLKSGEKSRKKKLTVKGCSKEEAIQKLAANIEGI